MKWQIGNAKLNEDLEIVDGNLFNEKNSLTERELDLLNGSYNDEQMVEKYEFSTHNNTLSYTQRVNNTDWSCLV